MKRGWIDKFLTLTALIFAVCLIIHLIGRYLWQRVLWSDISVFTMLQIILMFIASILLLLDFFSVKIKPVQNKYWSIFAAFGCFPLMPYAALGFPLMIIYLVGKIAELMGLC